MKSLRHVLMNANADMLYHLCHVSTLNPITTVWFDGPNCMKLFCSAPLNEKIDTATTSQHNINAVVSRLSSNSAESIGTQRARLRVYPRHP
eukprot:3310916-Rhodomonas_salina.1